MSIEIQPYVELSFGPGDAECHSIQGAQAFWMMYHVKPKSEYAKKYTTRVP